MRDIVKIKNNIQTKLFEKKIITNMKPFTTEFKPPERTVKSWEEIFTKQSQESIKKFLKLGEKKKEVKTEQKTFDSMLKDMLRPDVEAIVAFIKPFPKSKPFNIPKVELETKPEGKASTITETILKQESPEITIESEPFSSEKISFKELMKAGRFDLDDFVRIRHPSAPSKTTPMKTGISMIGAQIWSMVGSEENILSDVAKNIDYASKVEQNRIQSVIRGDIFSNITDDLSKQINIQQQNMMQNSLDIQDRIQSQMQGQMRMQIQEQIQISIPELTFKNQQKIEEDIKNKLKLDLPGIDFFGIGGFDGGSFHVEVKKRQYVHGEKVYPTSYKRVTKRPLKEFDALAIGADIVGKNEKATFRLIPSDSKPSKSTKKVKDWFGIGFEFDRKPDGLVVEKTAYRINSPGEIRGISMRGWAARRKHR